MEFCSKAVVCNAFGSYDRISINKYPLEPLQDKIEVEVSFCGLNFADLYTRQGLFANRKLPLVLGIECAGVVTAVGCSKEHSLEVGQRVICYNYNGGLFQDRVRTSPNNVYPLPEYISFEIGAALFVNYLTAYFALFDIGNLKQNETVFIQSCAGGVGVAATQLARTVENVNIIGTCSENKQHVMKENSVDYVLSYDNLVQQLNKSNPLGVDLIIDNQSGHVFNELQSLLKPLGRIVTIGANSLIQNDKAISLIKTFKLWWNMKNIPVFSLIEKNRVVGGLHLGVLSEVEPLKIRKTLDVLFNLFKDGKISPIIDSVWAFEDVVAAMKLLSERRNIGKVLLSINKEV